MTTTEVFVRRNLERPVTVGGVGSTSGDEPPAGRGRRGTGNPAAVSRAGGGGIARGSAALGTAALGTSLTLLSGGVAVGLGMQAQRGYESITYWRADDVVALSVLAVGALFACWYALTGLAVVLGIVTRQSLGVGRWGAPVARRLAIGLTFTLVGALPVAASTDVPDDLSLASLATPVATLESAPPAALVVETPPSAALEVETPPRVPTPRREDVSTGQHVVRPGESLWAIASAELVRASNEQIATRVTEWIEANPEVAADPDFIHIGQVLNVPGSSS